MTEPLETEAQPRHLGEVLMSWARLRADRIAYRFLVDGESEVIEVTYSELDRRARAIAVALSEVTAPGEPVVLLFPPGIDFIAAFFGCLYSGRIAVPTYPPTHRSIPKLNAILVDSGAPLALTTQEGRARLLNYASAATGATALRHLRFLSTDEIASDRATAWTPPDSGHETLAFLQYTSGSTSTPRGVMVSNGNLLHQERALLRAFDNDPNYDWVSWLPFYHDMGLIAGVLQPLYTGRTCTLLAPVAFVQRPSRWLEAISRYRANVSGAPDFAYDLCADKVTDAQKSGLDLSCWHVAFNGAEPVRARSHQRFAEAFAPCRFRAQSLFPIYGLAEATLVVTAGHALDFSSPVSCGPPIGDATVVIANPETLSRCTPGETGEILVRSESVTKGYWKRPADSAAIFGAYLSDTGEGPFLRTGDLGFERNGQFYIGSRLKDLIIIRGVNHSPQDIEFTVSGCDPALRGGMEAAFSIDVDGVEQLVVVKELSRENLRRVDAPVACAAIREAIARDHEIEIGSIVLVKPNVLPRTTSGKVQRRQTRQIFLADSLEPVARYDRPRTAPVPETPGGDRSPFTTLAAARQWLLSKLSLAIGIDTSRIDIREPLTRYGIGSLQAVQLSGEMEAALGRRVAPTIAWEFPTVDGLAHYLCGQPVNTSERPGAALHEPIAIVGMACRFPGAADPEAFWELLVNGREQITETGEDRWNVDAFFDPDPDAPGKIVSRRGGFLPRVDLFDAEFFGISAREATAMDPQQRLLLEVSWEALERAGQSPERVAGSRTGVFGGICFGDYSAVHWNSGDPARVDSFAGTGSMFSIAMGRISYSLGLHGPNLAIDTACSSSLVAVHMACQSLRQGECDLALAGGVNLMLAPEPAIFLSKSHALAPDGRCKAFDASADGYVRGEGCGMIVLRRLSDALAAKDNILAVVRGSAVNHDGRSNGLTAPSGAAQQAVIREAVERAGVKPGDVSYVETHGTGTPLGDPIEARALAAALRPGSVMPLLIGSVKTNIGHLEAAAGIAGVIKTVLALGHSIIPPHLHFHEMNPRIGGEVPVRVPVAITEWPGRRLAGVSSFGFSGTNAHVIVEEAPRLEIEPQTERPEHVLTLSAKTPEALRDLVDRYQRALLAEPKNLADFCYTANTGRSHFAHRAAGWGGRAEEIAQRLSNTVPDNALVAFLFSGQGAQRAGMARQLYETQPVFREAINRCAEIEPGLLDVLYGSKSGEIDQTQYTQPALFAIEWALAQMWQSWGVRPAAVLGHSVGEYVAACVADAMDWQDGLRLVAARGRLMQSLPSGGEMWAVEASEEEIRPFITGAVSIAAINAARSVVLSGSRDAVREVARQFRTARQLTVSHAFHSALMEPILDEMESLAGTVVFRPGNIVWISNITGREMTGVVTARYWRDQLRQTVRFADGIQSLRQRRIGAYVEIGPDPVLLGAARQDAEADNALWLPALRHGREDCSVTLETLASLYTRGVDIDWVGFDKPWARRKVILPTYPFQRKRYWMDRQPRAANVPLYKIRWSPLAASASLPDWSGQWLILADRAGFGQSLAEHLRGRGAECSIAEYGTAFNATGKRVVNLWALEAAVDEQETALASLVETVRQAPARVWIITRRAQSIDGDSDSINVAQTPIWGLGKVAALEHPDVWGGLIDIDDATDLGAVIPELAGNNADHIALRRGARYTASLDRIEATSSSEIRLDGSGTYLITGGAGAIGRRLAAYLKARGAGRLILAGRTPPTETPGAEFVALDVSDARAVRRLIDSLPELRGVIHAAGELWDAVLLNQKNFARALAAKALGAWHLHEATADRKLDFFILFSSVASLEGLAGQGSYAAANAFLDGLAVYRHQQNLPALSINWGPWTGTGMAANLTGIKDPGSIDPAAAITTFGLLANETQAQVAVLPDKLFEKIRAARRRLRLGTQQQVAPRDIRRFVESEARAVLGMDASQSLDWKQPLRDCGLTSLLAVELRNRLAEGLHRNLPPELLFHYPSVGALGEFFDAIATPKQEDLSKPGATAHEPIAIVGMGCRFPQADNPEAFWRLLRRGGCAITEVPPDRWDPNVWYDADLSRPGTMNTRWGGFLEYPDQFDPNFFGISYREACGMDPQQRLLLEVVWEALENAGQAPDRLAGSETGVFIGISSSDFGALLLDPPQRGSTGVVPSVAASRISYVLDLRGPSMAVDTACSSSLVAVDLACQSLRNGRCDLALAGGVNIILCPDTTISISQAGMMAPDGLCKTFDASADGYVRSEGCGIAVLKRLSDAVRNRDPILAVLRGTAVVQDGRSNGLTAPNALAQQKVIRQALADGAVGPEQISFVEAHGTGTSLGDVVEVGALATVLGHAGEQPCYIGSLKTNMGHLEAAAGIAGVIKTVLALQHEEIPTHINLKEVNPKLDLAGNRLRIEPLGATWKRGEATRVAGVSSFGFGGTIAHAVIEEAPPRVRSVQASQPELFVLSARSETALRGLALRYVKHLESNRTEHLADVCYTAAAGRCHWPHRLAVSVASSDELRQELAAFGAGNPAAVRRQTAQQNQLPRLAFFLPEDADGREDLLPMWAGLGVTPEAVSNASEWKDGWLAVDPRDIPGTLTELYLNGFPIDWEALYRNEERLRIGLPTYPFERRRCWLESSEIKSFGAEIAAHSGVAGN